MRKGLTLVSIAALSLGLAACHKQADTTTTDNTTVTDNAMTADANGAMEDTNVATAVPTPTMTGQEFADAAAKSDAFELAEGKLAAKLGKDQKVKDFAAEMIKAHTESTAKLKAAAMAADPKITPDPTLKPDQQAKVDALGKLSGDDFDKQYGKDQVAAHTDALAAMQAYGAGGDVPSIKDFASSTAVVVSSHLDMAKKLP